MPKYNFGDVSVGDVMDYRRRIQRQCARLGIPSIPAICTGPEKHEWTDAPDNRNGAIRAPSLDNCLCFHCNKPLRPHPKYAQLQPADPAKAPKRPRRTVQMEMFQ